MCPLEEDKKLTAPEEKKNQISEKQLLILHGLEKVSQALTEEKASTDVIDDYFDDCEKWKVNFNEVVLGKKRTLMEIAVLKTYTKKLEQHSEKQYLPVSFVNRMIEQGGDLFSRKGLKAPFRWILYHWPTKKTLLLFDSLKESDRLKALKMAIGILSAKDLSSHAPSLINRMYHSALFIWLKQIENELKKKSDDSDRFLKYYFEKINQYAAKTSVFLSSFLLYNLLKIVIIATQEIKHQHDLYEKPSYYFDLILPKDKIDAALQSRTELSKANIALLEKIISEFTEKIFIIVSKLEENLSQFFKQIDYHVIEFIHREIKELYDNSKIIVFNELSYSPVSSSDSVLFKLENETDKIISFWINQLHARFYLKEIDLVFNECYNSILQADEADEIKLIKLGRLRSAFEAVFLYGKHARPFVNAGFSVVEIEKAGEENEIKFLFPEKIDTEILPVTVLKKGLYDFRKKLKELPDLKILFLNEDKFDKDIIKKSVDVAYRPTLFEEEKISSSTESEKSKGSTLLEESESKDDVLLLKKVKRSSSTIFTLKKSDTLFKTTDAPDSLEIFDALGKSYTFKKIDSEFFGKPSFLLVSSSIPEASEILLFAQSARIKDEGLGFKSIKDTEKTEKLDGYLFKIKTSIPSLKEQRPLVRMLPKEKILSCNQHLEKILRKENYCFFVSDAILIKKGKGSGKVKHFELDLNLDPISTISSKKIN